MPGLPRPGIWSGFPLRATEEAAVSRRHTVARPATGEVVERETRAGIVIALRFRAYGKRRYVTLGSRDQGWTRSRAAVELRGVLADVERGIWQPHAEPAPQSPEAPTFHAFASQWLEGRRGELRPRTAADYEWALSYHLLPFFKAHRLDAITVQEVDRYKAAKLAEAKLGAAQVNKTLKVLAQIMDLALEYELIDRANPARGRRRRVKVTPPKRTWVEPEQVSCLIDGGSSYIRPVIATLIGAGLRVSEACALDWKDANLATGTLNVGRAKTDAGSYGEVDLSDGLREELTEWKMRSAGLLARWQEQQGSKAEPMFLSAHAGRVRRQTSANVARRLKTAIKHANTKLDQLGIETVSDRVTPHSLRRTYASVRFALGDDPVYVAGQMGHADAGRLAANLYAKAVKRRAKLSGVYLAEFDKALAWASMGTERALAPSAAVFGRTTSIDSDTESRLVKP
jgi:integrase